MGSSRKRWILGGSFCVIVAALLIYAAATFDISARQKPGELETYMATRVKHWLVARGVARMTASEASGATSVGRGRALYDSCCSACLGEEEINCSNSACGGATSASHTGQGADTCETCFISCAMCHGEDGRTPTKAGLALYPPTPSLASPEVQQYTDEELFFVIKNGIRFTGMPGFADLHSDQDIRHLVRYIRSLVPANSTSAGQ